MNKLKVDFDNITKFSILTSTLLPERPAFLVKEYAGFTLFEQPKFFSEHIDLGGDEKIFSYKITEEPIKLAFTK